MLEQLQARGYQPGDVKRILITHAHPDHVAGLPRLKAVTGAQVIASALEKPVIEGEMPVQRPPREALSGLARMIPLSETRFERTPVDRVVKDGETLAEIMEGLQVVATPGHTPGHITFWQPDKRLLFCGDVILHIFGLRLPLALFTVDMAENIRSIHRLAELDASIVCFGHGNSLTANAAQIMRTFARKVGAM